LAVGLESHRRHKIGTATEHHPTENINDNDIITQISQHKEHTTENAQTHKVCEEKSK